MNSRIIFSSERRNQTLLRYVKLFERSNFQTRYFQFKKPVSSKERLDYINSFFKEIKNFNPDFIYVDDEFSTKTIFLIIFIRKLFFKKFKIITFIAYQLIPDYNNLFNRIKIRFLLKNIDFLFCRNNKDLKKIKNINLFKNYSQLFQVYWGFSKELFYEINQPKEVIAKSFDVLKINYSKIRGKYVLGYIGRIVPEKDLTILLECLVQLPDNFILVYAGEYNNQEYQKKIEDFIKQNNLKERVVYLGYVVEKNLKFVYNILDLMILPTTIKYNGSIELFGSVLAEAMLCKRLVIGSDNGSIPEVIGREDLIFKESNQKDLLRLINYVYSLKQKEKEVIINENYNRAINNFTDEIFVEKIVNTVKGL